jgi:hypothetical protein
MEYEQGYCSFRQRSIPARPDKVVRALRASIGHQISEDRGGEARIVQLQEHIPMAKILA